MAEPSGLIAKSGIELLTFGTPNGHKISVLLEELKEAYGKEYTVQSVNIMKNTQKQPWYTALNPNGRIPTIIDHDRGGFAVFEGLAILTYLARHYDPEHKFSFPVDSDDYSVAEQWISWQHGGVGPMQGQANHFLMAAPEKIPYAIQRYVGETERLYGILNARLADRDYVAGPGRGKYSIADMSLLGWVNNSGAIGLDLPGQFPNVKAWLDRLLARPAVQRGLTVPGGQLGKWSYANVERALKGEPGTEELLKTYEEGKKLVADAKEKYGYNGSPKSITATMKRKLDSNDEPTAAPPETENKPSQGEKQPADAEPSFAELGLDPRLVQAVAKQGFEKPTLVQRKAIPLALQGQDVLCKAKTGSGKTAAYVLPLLSAILKRKSTDSTPFTAGLILVPTRELADQVFKAIEQFSAFCAKDIHAAKLTENVSDAVQRSLLANVPDIVVSTPARAWHSVNSSALTLSKLQYLVLDEADLVLSYGYDEDMENISRSLPKGVQTIMMSATLSAELDTLKGIFCRNPTLLDLKEEFGAEDEKLTQFYVKCGEDDKWLISYLIFKLQLIKGPCLIFVADIDRSYRLKLYFEQFGIRSCVLNSELPINTRIKIIEEFNRGIYDIIIASDEKSELFGDEAAGAEGEKKESKKESKKGGEEGAEKPKKKRKHRKDEEYGVSRGIDFKNVAAVINFDMPTSAKSYTHRIGRTARAGRAGIALSFVIPKELYGKHRPTSIKSCENDEKVLAKIMRQQAKINRKLEPYNFNKSQMEAFRYRMNDALRAVTKVAIREARTRELRQELLRSETLKRYFEENPTELAHLRHDGELGRTTRQLPHLKHVPDYLLPKEGKKALASQQVGFVPFKKEGGKDRRHRKGKPKGRSFKVGGKKDPLKTFKVRRKVK
ncbi:P-loop containing nucleoside triphosphate hydrolase protein [Achaetomium macrosporum]|uniref:RNA helicase n=1 Tax=Achaetomium macrosporum TaxID=79813 RepID=A0AAN7HE52_9PEZI|nr:P-loop containing nucleoside triphosphate hydrolase protein [Achaetomium macrosporum]